MWKCVQVCVCDSVGLVFESVCDYVFKCVRVYASVCQCVQVCERVWKFVKACESVCQCVKVYESVCVCKSVASVYKCVHVSGSL